MHCCTQCGVPVTRDEIGLTKKLINRGAREYLCIECLAKMFECPTDALRVKIEEWRAAGCALFVDLSHLTGVPLPDED